MMCRGWAACPVPPVSSAWLMLVSGLVLLAAAMLIPAWRDAQAVAYERDRLAAQVEYEARRVDRGEMVLAGLSANDPQIRERLIAWQFNLIPKEAIPVARELHAGGILGWIDSSVEPASPVPPQPVVTTLEQLVTGPARLWILAMGGLLVFVGIIGPPAMRGDPRGLRSE